MTSYCDNRMPFFVSGVLLKLMSKWRRQFDGCEGNGDLVPPSPTIVATHFTILTES